METHLEVIDAFVDGERVDPGALKTALADPSGRDYFVDAWMLREAVRQDLETAGVDRASSAVRRPRTAGKWPGKLIVAAALVIGVAGGYFAAYRAPQSPASPQVSPVQTATVATQTPGVFPAPPPTRVIQLEFQIDPSRSGGN